jgi:LCP family protein required for cell wall assembly
MRISPWTAAVVVASLAASALLYGAFRSYSEFRAFAERIHEPLTDDAPAATAETRAYGTPGATVMTEDGTAGVRLANTTMPFNATFGAGTAYYGTVDNSIAGHRPASDDTGGDPHVPERIGKLDGSPFVVLFIGVDRRTGDRGRADALIAVALNPGKASSLAVSIPRDTRTGLIGLDRPVTDKINHAYAFGGVRSTVATAEQFLGVPVSRYIQADMEGFRAMVDIVGGVRVDNGRAFAYEGFVFPEGTLELDGEAALAYVRMRKDDPRGDLGRADRQKAVLSGLAKSVIRPDMIDKWPELLEELSRHMKTDLTFEDWKALVKHYRKAAAAVETEQIEGSGLMLDGIYYFSVSEAERSRITARLAEHLAP